MTNKSTASLSGCAASESRRWRGCRSSWKSWPTAKFGLTTSSDTAPPKSRAGQAELSCGWWLSPSLSPPYVSLLAVRPGALPGQRPNRVSRAAGDGPCGKGTMSGSRLLSLPQWEAEIVTPDFDQLDASVSQGVNEAPDGGIVELGRAQDGSGRFHRFNLTEILEQIDWHCARNSDLVSGLPHCASMCWSVDRATISET